MRTTSHRHPWVSDRLLLVHLGKFSQEGKMSRQTSNNRRRSEFRRKKIRRAKTSPRAQPSERSRLRNPSEELSLLLRHTQCHLITTPDRKDRCPTIRCLVRFLPCLREGACELSLGVRPHLLGLVARNRGLTGLRLAMAHRVDLHRIQCNIHRMATVLMGPCIHPHLPDIIHHHIHTCRGCHLRITVTILLIHPHHVTFRCILILRRPRPLLRVTPRKERSTSQRLEPRDLYRCHQARRHQRRRRRRQRGLPPRAHPRRGRKRLLLPLQATRWIVKNLLRRLQR